MTAVLRLGKLMVVVAVIFILFLVGMFLPYQGVLIPLVLTLQRMGLYDSIAGVIFVHCIFGIPICTLMFRGYFAGVPNELVDAAKQEILELDGVAERLAHLSQTLQSELEIVKLERKIEGQVRSQVHKNQKEFYLNEQLKAIRKELGYQNEFAGEVEELERQIKKAQMPKEVREKAEKETGEKKSAFLNITADVETMKKRADLLATNGWNYAMIDVVVAGTAGVMTMRDYCSDLGLAIHAHRAMHSAFTRNKKHGITMQFLAKIMRLVGVSQIHTGTAVGKLTGSRRESVALADLLREKKTKAVEGMLLEQDWGKIKSAFPVSSGGLHPGLVPDVMDIYGTEMVLLVSGGIHGHPKGTRAGAQATMQAIEAWQEGVTLEEKAKTAKELREALGKWGHYKPV